MIRRAIGRVLLWFIEPAREPLAFGIPPAKVDGLESRRFLPGQIVRISPQGIISQSEARSSEGYVPRMPPAQTPKFW